MEDEHGKYNIHLITFHLMFIFPLICFERFPGLYGLGQQFSFWQFLLDDFAIFKFFGIHIFNVFFIAFPPSFSPNTLFLFYGLNRLLNLCLDIDLIFVFAL